MQQLSSYKTLIVWQKAYQLALLVYSITKDFPKNELYGLVSQMRRAALSVVANIAEGYIRASRKDRLHFYNMALGSLTELECYFLFSRDIGYFTGNDFQKTIILQDEVMRLLRGFIGSQRN